ncbi:NAD-dependent epimerase/dehydratase, male-sterility like protein [Sodalis praecaptivus]|uniref:NAD-dependent epimerase/dehydratase, male-sterility like protein n=1 Tax=Sodalis praecaptivus TaxID=1239307 RepID=W0I298_9GAMM|nr:epimerase [Sodalis praecaptivus]AHF78595.1 NAD-dependent epimerase/dehydratase, male-sterility like protein [Sodalis praecaptivus]
MKTALLFGASGLVGGNLLSILLGHRAYGQVIAVVRRELPLRHPQLIQLIGDIDTLPAQADALAAQDVFIALGTTRKNSPDRRDYYRIDHDYPLLAARLALEQGARSLSLVSAVGASVGSYASYLRIKGETERDIIALRAAQTHLFQPGMILGERQERRPLERGLNRVWPRLDPLLRGRAKKYRAITAADIAAAMVAAAQLSTDEVMIYTWQEMRSLALAAH